MKTDYKGIDYGLGQSNIDHKTGIRYGVINQNDVGQAWFDESIGNYYYICPECEHELGEEYPDEKCPECHYRFDDFDFDFLDPVSFTYFDEKYDCFQAMDDTDIFVFKSPYFTYAQFCSPCAPGAVYLMNPMESNPDNPRGYCFGHDWFDSGIAPYPVYDVKTGKRVAADGGLCD